MLKLDIYLWCLAGIVTSTVLPLLWAYARKTIPGLAPPEPKAMAVRPVWLMISPYLALGAASSLTALLLVAFLGDQLTDFRAAILAGYAWDSTLQKLRDAPRR